MVDIHKWLAEVSSFYEDIRRVTMKLEVNLFYIILSLSQVLAFIFALLFALQYISNMGTAFCFLTIFFVFALPTVVLKFTVHNLYLCFKFIQHMYNQISIFYYLNAIKTLNSLFSGYILHLFLLQH